MKRAFLIAGIILLSASTAMAQAVGQTQRNAGCGLGTMIFADKAETTLFQVLAVTTNATLFNQTFGITSGTLGCERPSSFVENERINEFVLANLDDLAKDIATGRGESLGTLAELMNVPSGERESFYRNLQSHFAEIFPSPGVEYAHVVDAIVRIANRG